MKKNITGLVVLAIVGIGAYFYFIQFRKVIDCGTDENCFTTNLKTCTPAKYLGGTFTIKGGSAKNCEIYNESKGFSDLGENKNIGMTCFVDVGDYEKSAKNNKMPLGIDFYIFSKLDSCSGPLKDQTEAMFGKGFFGGESTNKATQEELKQQEKFKDVNYSISILEDQTQSKKMRYGAENALCEIETKNTEAFNSLLTVFSNKEEKEPNLRYAIAICFRGNKELRAVDALIQALKDNDGMMRFKSAQVLGELKIQKAVAPLENMFKNDSDETVRTRAARSLEMITGNSYR